MAHESTSLPASDKYFFLMRRLHSLSGLVPVGAYVCFHLIINSTILAGPEAYQAAVNQIDSLKELGLLFVVEMTFIFIPIAFHAIIGVLIISGGKWNSTDYRYGSNVRFTLERITGIIALLFIALHVWQMHWFGKPMGGGVFIAHDAANTAAKAIQGSWIWGLVYLIGVSAAVFHLANGIWTALITWGVTIGPRSQRIAGYFCTAFGIALGIVGLLALYGFETHKVGEPPAGDHASPEVVARAAGHVPSGESSE